MSKDSDQQVGISFQAVFTKATTLVDGSWRISFDVNPSQVPEIIKISQLLGYSLQVAVIPLPRGERG